MPKLTQGNLNKIEIPCPDVATQRGIVEALGSLDNRITLLRETNQTLEAIAQAIFKSWFVDFDPVRAKMEGRQPVGMDEETAALFPDELVESELGLIPKGWETVSFSEFLTDTIGGDWGKDSPDIQHDQAVRIIRGTDFQDVRSGGGNKAPIRYTTTKKLISRKLAPGDIVVEVSGGSPTQPTGRSIFITHSLMDRFAEPLVCASFCRRFRPKNYGLGLLAYLHLQALYQADGTWAYQNQSTGIANFQTTRFLRDELILRPPEPVVHLFVEQVSTLLSAASSNLIQTLCDLRDTLLPRLISGKLRVPVDETEAVTNED